MNTLGESQKESGAADETMLPHQISRRDLFTKSLVAGVGVIGLGLLDELPAYAATLDPENPLAPANTLQVVGLAKDGTIWHTIRFANGSWQSNFGNVNNQEGNGGSLRFTDLDCAGIGGDLQVVAVATDGTIWHTIRFANGSWQSNFGNVNNQEGNGGSLRFTNVACANVGGNLQVVGLATDGTIWHTIRFANGSWQSNFGNVNNQEGNGGSLRFTDLDCAGISGGNLHITAIATDGTIWHTIRFANGSWQSNFGNVNNQEGNGGSLRFTDVGCAGIGGDLHVTAVSRNGIIWHTIRFANGSWQSTFGNVNNQEGNGGSLRFTNVDCANVGGNLHVAAVNRNGIIWHTIRFANGSWQSTFGNVNNQEGNGGSLRFTDVGTAGVM